MASVIARIPAVTKVRSSSDEFCAETDGLPPPAQVLTRSSENVSPTVVQRHLINQK
jgi:hypothetical protein